MVHKIDPPVQIPDSNIEIIEVEIGKFGKSILWWECVLFGHQFTVMTDTVPIENGLLHVSCNSKVPIAFHTISGKKIEQAFIEALKRVPDVLQQQIDEKVGSYFNSIQKYESDISFAKSEIKRLEEEIEHSYKMQEKILKNFKKHLNNETQD